MTSRAPAVARRGRTSADAEADDAIDAELALAAPRLRSFVESIAQDPELGFFETKTARAFARQLRAASLSVRTGIARTGVIAELRSGKPGPTIAVIGELDAMPMDDSEARSRAIHSCGHHLQLGIVAGVASALRPIAASLSGTIRFIGVPAEEFVEVGKRLELRATGEIVHLSGKAEFVRSGYFDDVDMALLVHATTRQEEAPFAVGGGTNAMVAKWVTYEGITAHAGAAPHRGVNALAAAVIGLTAINAIRDTFRDENRIRVHGIISRGGSAVNAVPADVRLEIYVRGASRGAVEEAERKVDRAIWAGALAVGARVTIATIPGYLPLLQDAQLEEVARSAAGRVLPADLIRRGVDRAGSTDMGDISHLMPALQVWSGGVSGELHSSTFQMESFDIAVLTPARIVSRMLVDLLGNGATRAVEISRASRPALTREMYLAYLQNADRVDRFDSSTVTSEPHQ